MNKIILFLLCIFFGTLAKAEETLTLSELYSLAMSNNPLTKQYNLNLKSYELKNENLSTAYYPEMSIVSQAHYQSDVTKIELKLNIPGFQLPEIPVPSKDQYKISLNINQLIWDGGINAAQKKNEFIQNQIDKTNTDIQLFNVKQTINDLLFNILILQQRFKSIEILIKDLTNKVNMLKVRAESGVILLSNIDLIDAEILKLEQQKAEIKYLIKTCYESISELVGKKIDDATIIKFPEESIEFENKQLKRYEYELFTKYQTQLENSEDMINSKYLPKFLAFGQAMYAKPGLNMFDTDFQVNYIIGLKGSWNFWNWGEKNRDIEIINLRKSMIETNKEAFDLNLNILLNKYRNDMELFKTKIRLDEEIIMTRTRIAQNSELQFDSGTILATDYIGDLNNLAVAKLSKEINQIELIRTRINYLLQAGYFNN